MSNYNSLPRCPVSVRQAEYSMLLSADDEPTQPSEYLLDLAVKFINVAREIELSDLVSRMSTAPYYPTIWPGEHYRLLAAIVRVLKPKLVIEIGTASGLSALALKKFLDKDAKLITFDIIPWTDFSDTVFRSEDFLDGNLLQQCVDLRDPAVVNYFKPTLEDAEIIFIDAAKDGVGEYLFWNNLSALNFKSPPLLIFDDIRLWNMLKFWRSITMPKLDLTSFGHWSGTGIVEWRNNQDKQLFRMAT